MLAGAQDHYVPRDQLARQIHLLTNARSVTARLFTAGEHAQNHVHVGNLGLSLDIIVSWLEGLESRARNGLPADASARDGSRDTESHVVDPEGRVAATPHRGPAAPALVTPPTAT